MQTISRFQHVIAASFFFFIYNIGIASTTGGSASPMWTSLNNSVNGNLYKGVPFSLPCFSKFDGRSVSPDLNTCHEIQGNYTSPTYRVSHFGAHMLVRVLSYIELRTDNSLSTLASMGDLPKHRSRMFNKFLGFIRHSGLQRLSSMFSREYRAELCMNVS